MVYAYLYPAWRRRAPSTTIALSSICLSNPSSACLQPCRTLPLLLTTRLLRLNRYLSSRFPPPWEGPNLIYQPHPDPALLTTEPPSADNIADDAAKLNIVSSDFKSHPATTTSVKDVPSDAAPPAPSTPSKRRRYLDEVEQEGSYLFNVAKQYLFHPAIAGGLLGLSAYIDGVV